MPVSRTAKTLRRERDPGDYRRVPNSLGPGELLQHYGTDEQKITICHVWRVVRRSLALH